MDDLNYGNLRNAFCVSGIAVIANIFIIRQCPAEVNTVFISGKDIYIDKGTDKRYNYAMFCNHVINLYDHDVIKTLREVLR